VRTTGFNGGESVILPLKGSDGWPAEHGIDGKNAFYHHVCGGKSDGEDGYRF